MASKPATTTGLPVVPVAPAGAAPDEDPCDAALVLRAQRDRRAFAPLYRRYVDPVYRACHRRLGDREAAEDATSLVFARALAGIADCRPASFRPWLFAIVHNTLANEYRQRAAHPPSAHTATDLLHDPAPGPEDAALTQDARATVAALLAHLPPDQRQVVELRLAGLTGREIAQALGKSHGAVRVAQHRAVVRLRTLLENQGESPAPKPEPPHA
jgi:RNA polymerase sigma-70 factor (ECF subfamily)